MKKNKGLFWFFIQHKVAANLLMFFLLLLGGYGISRLNVQFLPNTNLNYITISVPWVGASASDTERSIIVPIEKRLKDLDGLKKMFSKANYGSAVVILEFNEDANMSQAYQDTQQRISTITNLPQAAERPIITRIERYEPIGKVIITGADSLSTIRELAYEYEKQLLDLGVAKINIVGMPRQELAVEVPPEKLQALGMTLPELANVVNEYSQDAAMGTLGKNQVAKELRMVKAVRTVESLSGIPVVNAGLGQVTTLGDIAFIRMKNREGESRYYQNGQPAIELQLLRAPTQDALHIAKLMHHWFEKARADSHAQGVSLKIYDENWLLIKQRIHLLVNNGLTGLVFIILMLAIFLNRRVAFWVAVSIPVSCLAALYFLYLAGGTLNMVSLFAVIMTLGIVVDDSIVVGENAYHEFRLGKTPAEAAFISAQRMFIPVLASSLTTIAAFIPLMLIKGVIGQILFAIPLVVICIIIASLFECFLVLPHHLKHSFKKITDKKRPRFRVYVDKHFAYFRDVVFNRVLVTALKNKWSVIVVSGMALIIAYSMLVGSHVSFTFFRVPESNIIKMNVVFTPGTKTDVVKAFLLKARNDLLLISKEEKAAHPSEPNLVNIVTESLSKTADLRRDQQFETGENVGHLNVELSQPDDRTLTNNQLVSRWHEKLKNVPGIISLVIGSPKGGPPGRDVDISLRGRDPAALKQASLYIQSELRRYAGVNNITDNLPGGREQWEMTLKPAAIKLGLTVRGLATQVNAAFNRRLVQRINEGQDEIDLVVSLPDKNKESLSSFLDFPIKLPSNKMVRLDSLVSVKAVRGFDRLVHEDGYLSVNVTADVDDAITNTNRVLTSIKESILKDLYTKYNVSYRLKGRAEEQAKTFSEMLTGMAIATALIYIILALIFSSYVWPFLVMLMIPFGLFGAILGHLVMGYDMTILSLFGLFGLAGILMNDSIILVNTYRGLKASGKSVYDSLVEAATLRLRPVILTSLTTIVGLTPILFETSRQAKFLIPMVISLVFGLLFATVIILLVLPCVFAVFEKDSV